MDTRLFALVGIWAVAAVAAVSRGLVDDEWRESEQGTAALVAEMLFMTGAVVALPSAVLIGLETLVPFTTRRGRNVGDLIVPVVGVVLAGVGLYFAWVVRFRGLMEPEEGYLSPAGQVTFWTVLGAAVAAAALVTAFL